MSKGLFFIFCWCSVFAVSATAQRKTVTNADLEKFRQKRLQAEREYRENYEKQNFPSPEELERQRVESRLENEEIVMRRRAERQENEYGFASQARALRSEIASVEAQINYLLAQFPANRPPTSYYTGGVAPFGYARNGRTNSIWSGDVTGRNFLAGSRTYAPNPSVFGNVRQNAPLTVNQFGSNQIGRGQIERNQIGRGGAYYGGGISVGINIGSGRLRHRYDPYGARPVYPPRNQVYGYAPYVIAGGSSYGYAPDDATEQLRRLQQERAGLYAEWQLLQDEAKRAGVRID